MTDAYKSRGVSSTKEDVHAAVAAIDKGLFPGAFCKITPDISGDPAYYSIMHTDDAGTKSILAYIAYRESGDPSVFAGIAQDSMVMNLDDMLCVGATDKFIFSNTIGRNAHRVGGDAVAALIKGYADFSAKMRQYGVNIIMSGGETSDTGDIVATIFVDSTFFARVKSSSIIDASKIRPGDVIIALASAGKATYETGYNSGIGSNGLTAARHLLLDKYYSVKYPESYSDTIAAENIYSGKFRMTDNLPESRVTVGEALLSPTRTYAPVIRRVLELHADDVRGIIHCTGGGQVKCKNFGTGLHFIKDNFFPIPPVFKAIYDSGQISMREMFSVFNMGHRMEIYANENRAMSIVSIAESFGVGARIVGRVETAESNKVTILHDGEKYEY